MKGQIGACCSKGGERRLDSSGRETRQQPTILEILMILANETRQKPEEGYRMQNEEGV